MRKFLRLAVLGGMLLGLAVPAPANDAAVEMAVQSAEEWLQLVDNNRYDQSYETAASEFKKVVTKSGWSQAISAARQPLGAVKERTLLSQQYATELPNAPAGEYVVIQFITHFANKDSAIETITPMRDTDGQWRVSGYYIK